MLHMQAVTKVYRTALVETHALRSLDLHVREGEFVAVTGPSGSGKTTFLNIAGLLEHREPNATDEPRRTKRPTPDCGRNGATAASSSAVPNPRSPSAGRAPAKACRRAPRG